MIACFRCRHSCYSHRRAFIQEALSKSILFVRHLHTKFNIRNIQSEAHIKQGTNKWDTLNNRKNVN